MVKSNEYSDPMSIIKNIFQEGKAKQAEEYVRGRVSPTHQFTSSPVPKKQNAFSRILEMSTKFH
jgi:hypothetical protein